MSREFREDLDRGGGYSGDDEQLSFGSQSQYAVDGVEVKLENTSFTSDSQFSQDIPSLSIDDDGTCAIGNGFSLPGFLAIFKNPIFSNLPSHFKWLMELEGDSIFDPRRLDILKKSVESWIEENNSYNSLLESATQRLLLAVYTCLLTGNPTEAQKHIVDAQKFIDAPPSAGSEPKTNLRVYKLVLKIDEYIIECICQLLLQKTGSGGMDLSCYKSVSSEFEKDAKRIIRTDTESVIWNMKRMISTHLGHSNFTLGGIFQEEEDEKDVDVKDIKMTDDDLRVIKLRGLPWTASKSDVTEFFNDCKIYKGHSGIHLVTNSAGRSTGEAFVDVPPDDDIEVFLRKHKKTMGHRYIEVFQVKRSEVDWAMRSARTSDDEDSEDSRGHGSASSEESERWVRLRGLPYECTKEDISTFFKGLEIASNGIQLMMDHMGRPSGEAYVHFTAKDQAEKARGYDRQSIGSRYIETFRVSSSELKNMRDMTSRYGGRGGGGYERHHPYDRGGRYDRYGGGGGGGGGGSMGRSRYNSRGYEDDWSYNGGGGGGWGGGGGGGGSRYSRYDRPDRGPRGVGNRYSAPRGTSPEKNAVLMRGLPFKADEYDIKKFFDPLVPVSVDIIYESSGRPSGTAKVVFANGDDVTRAMGKHKERMEHRYIELFLHTT